MGVGNIILPDTSLATIVRDELCNPAGGIARFVAAVAPHVEEAVIVDTGSTDGTRQKLEELQGIYRNLRVYDAPFESYAQARNESLELIQTRRALVLDADELIVSSEWPVIAEELNAEPHVESWDFDFKHILPDGTKTQRPTHNTRLFDAGAAVYVEGYGEHLQFFTDPNARNLHVRILHFLPEKAGLATKDKNWYETYHGTKRTLFNFWKPRKEVTSPVRTKGFASWKAYNPQRDNYA